MAAAAGRPTLGGPRANPSGDAPRIQSPPGKGKPVALADITNTGRGNFTRTLSVADVVQENAKLIQLLNEKMRIIELSRVQMQKLHLALQASRQQNLQLAQTNSQMLAELNLGKDKLKALQHELSCKTALLKVKDSELEKKNKVANQRRKDVNSQDIMKVIPSKVAAFNAHRIDGSVTSANEHPLFESRSVVPSSTAYQEPPNDKTKRGRNKRKSESNEGIKETNMMQDHYEPHLQPILSTDHEDPRRPVRRRSTRLNPGSCEVVEVSCSKLSEDDIVPSAPSSFSVQKQYGTTTGRNTQKSMQNEQHREAVMFSGFKKMEINEQLQKEANLKVVQEAYSSVPGIEALQVGGKASSAKESYLEEMQSSLPSKIVDHPKALKGTGNDRVINKQKLKSGKDSAMEQTNAKSYSNTSEPLRPNEKRNFQRRKSARLDSILPDESTMITSETLYEDIIAPLRPSSTVALMEQTINQKQTDASSTKATESQVVGRRSLRRAAEKVVSYKEIPLNVKMRRP